MSADRIDVFSVMDRYGFTCGDQDSDCSKARAAVAELIAADREYDEARESYAESRDNTAFASHKRKRLGALILAEDRRRLAIARIGGDA